MLQARFNRQMRTRGNSSVIFYKLAITPRYKAYSKTNSKHKCALIVDEHKLDNPAWNSLSETHQRQSIAFEAIQFYDPNYCAIVTHPNHTRKGYAKQLIKHTTDKVFLENKIPYLHVLESNIHAISLYEKLGFITRRKSVFGKLS